MQTGALKMLQAMDALLSILLGLDGLQWAEIFRSMSKLGAEITRQRNTS